MSIKYIEIIQPGTQGPAGPVGPPGPPADPAGPGVTNAPATLNALSRSEAAVDVLPQVRAGTATRVSHVSGRHVLRLQSPESGNVLVTWTASASAIKSGVFSAGVRLVSALAQGGNLSMTIEQRPNIGSSSGSTSSTTVILTPEQGALEPINAHIADIPLEPTTVQIALSVQRYATGGNAADFQVEYPWIADGDGEVFVPAAVESDEVAYTSGSVPLGALDWPFKSRNLVDARAFIPNTNIQEATGAEVYHASIGTSPLIVIEPGVQLNASTVDGPLNPRWSFYDRHRGYLGGVVATSTVAPPQARFVRVSTAAFNNRLMVNTGPAALPWEAFEETLERAPEWQMGKNLLDSEDIIPDHYLHPGDGQPSPQTGSAVTRKFIPVTPGRFLHSNRNVACVFYTARHQMISRVVITSVPSGAQEVPADARYVRFSGSMEQFTIGAMVWYVGDRPLGWEPWHMHEKPVQPLVPHQSRPFQLDVPDDMYRAGDTLPWIDSAWGPNGSGGFSVDYLYEQWDDLVSANAAYITKATLGQDQSGTYDILELLFKPEDVGGQAGMQRPKLLILANIHGMEETCAWVTYLFFRDLCERWQSDKHLRWLRNSIEFRVIPSLNPWGLQANTRTNSRGVDLNRNFESFREGGVTDPDSPYYQGPYALSEAEAVIADNWMGTNLDAFAYVDFHDFGIQGERVYWGEIPAFKAHNPVLVTAQRQTAYDMTALAQAEYGAPLFTMLGDNTSNVGSGSNGQAAYVHGLPSALVEVAQRPDFLSNDPEGAVKLAVEVFGNAILNTARAFARFGRP